MQKSEMNKSGVIPREIAFGRWIAVLSVWPLTSAGFQSAPEQVAPTPGEEYRIAPADLKAVEGRALVGDVPSINRLVDHYMLSVGDEAKGIFWLERLGDTGDQEARATVLHYLDGHPAQGTTAYIDELRKRWNAPRE